MDNVQNCDSYINIFNIILGILMNIVIINSQNCT
jgi:hypothetical protein